MNPHDITLWGSLALAGDLSGAQGSFYLAEQLVGSNVPQDLFGPAYTQSTNEDLSTKPVAQKSFVSQYPKAFQPLRNDSDYHRFYYQLQKNVDEQIGKVINAFTDDRTQYRDTIVIYLSDHGEMLGAHGGMFQKWHAAYDEMLRVPFMFHNPELFPTRQSSDILTSHADLIPTMLGLAGLDEAVLAKELRNTHTQVRRLVGPGPVRLPARRGGRHPVREEPGLLHDRRPAVQGRQCDLSWRVCPTSPWTSRTAWRPWWPTCRPARAASRSGGSTPATGTTPSSGRNRTCRT